MWAIGDAEVVTTTEGIIRNKTQKTGTTKKIVNNIDYNDLSEKEQKQFDDAIAAADVAIDKAGETIDMVNGRRQAKWNDATLREQELIDDGALTDLSQAYKEEA